MNIKEYIEKNGYIVTDGAMGTYYSMISENDTTMSEKANIENPDIIEKIHNEYIKAGAKLIRTNTFSANTHALKKNKDFVKKVISEGYKIAEKSAKEKNVYIGASIGPIVFKPEENIEKIYDEYIFIVDTFIECGAEIFIFETFSCFNIIDKVVEYIKSKNKDYFVLTQFAVLQNGYTGQGISIKNIVKTASENKNIDAYGFNCGTGPTHIYNNIKSFNFEGNIVSVLPNAGFPEIVNRKVVYNFNPDYFAQMMKTIKNAGVKIIGGCCGTTPEYIKKLCINLEKKLDITENIVKISIQDNKNAINIVKTERKIDIAVELDPPFGIDIDKIMKSAESLKDTNIKFITISDSPIGKVRVNSILTAAKIKNTYGIDVMPHICCRDRNIIGLKSDILGAYINGIRNILAVTGDPIASADRSEIKSVFNLNSMGLIELIRQLNEEQFSEDKVNIAAALNLNVVNKNAEITRMYKKIEKGANLFLTQPIFDEDTIEYFINMKKEKNIKIYTGIMPLVSYKNAMFLHNEIPGINIPDKYINMFNENMSREEAEQTGIEIAVETASKLIDYTDGFYMITPFNRVNIIKKIIEILGI